MGVQLSWKSSRPLIYASEVRTLSPSPFYITRIYSPDQLWWHQGIGDVVVRAETSREVSHIYSSERSNQPIRCQPPDAHWDSSYDWRKSVHKLSQLSWQSAFLVRTRSRVRVSSIAPNMRVYPNGIGSGLRSRVLEVQVLSPAPEAVQLVPKSNKDSKLAGTPAAIWSTIHILGCSSVGQSSRLIRGRS